MADALKECPGIVANDLYSKQLIAKETVDKVNLTSLTPHEKATILLMAVEPAMADSKSDRALRKLCGILAKHPNMKRLSNHIMEKYGELYEPISFCHVYIFKLFHRKSRNFHWGLIFMAKQHPQKLNLQRLNQKKFVLTQN